MEWTDPQTGEKWYRKGECTHCGACCSLWCPYLKWIALRDIKKGEVFQGTGINSGNIRSFCSIFDKPIDVKTDCVQCKYTTRQKFPSTPLSTPKCCGYYWVNEEGKKWVREEHDYSKGVLTDPTYYLTNQGTGYESLWKLLETAPASADDTTIVTFPKDETGYIKVKPGKENDTVESSPTTDPPNVGWRTAEPLNIQIPAGTWTFYITLITGKNVTGDLKVYVRLTRSPEELALPEYHFITDWIEIVSVASPSADTTYNLSGSTNIGQVTFSNEYLFVDYYIRTTIACSAATGCSVTFRCNEGANQRIDTPTLAPPGVFPMRNCMDRGGDVRLRVGFRRHLKLKRA